MTIIFTNGLLSSIQTSRHIRLDRRPASRYHRTQPKRVPSYSAHPSSAASWKMEVEIRNLNATPWPHPGRPLAAPGAIHIGEKCLLACITVPHACRLLALCPPNRATKNLLYTGAGWQPCQADVCCMCRKEHTTSLTAGERQGLH